VAGCRRRHLTGVAGPGTLPHRPLRRHSRRVTDALDATRRAVVASGGYSEPTEPVGGWWTARFALVWFGAWMGTLVPVQLLLPEQLEKLDPVHKVRDFGLVNGLTGVLALLTLPLLGAWCDRTTSRFGRRRVWVLSGAVVFAVGLVTTGLQTHWVGVGLAWLVASLGMNASSVGLTATVADRVPERQRGTISGALYGPQAVGIVVGLLLVTTVVTSIRGGYLLLAVSVLVCAAPFVLSYQEAVVPGAPRLSAAEVVAGLWEVPRHNRDFAWAFGSRVLVNLGNALDAQRDAAGAASAYDQALAINPREPLAYFNLGKLALERGDAARAVQMYERTIALDASLVPAYFNLARAYAMQSNAAKAKAALEQGLAFDPNNAEGREMLRTLQQAISGQ